MLTQALVDELNALFEIELGVSEEKAQIIKKWTCSMIETVIGEYVVVPLTSKKMVKSEGYMMRNCCREYIPSCMNGEYLLFSIQSFFGKRIATLGVVKGNGRWALDDCLGPCNIPVMEENEDYKSEDGEYVSEIDLTDIYSVAHEVVRLMNRKQSVSTM